jgi:glycosyltransferase involved in cell wall biosynthesis
VIGGYELACKQMVDALRSRGHEVTVLASSPRVSMPSEQGVERSLRLSDWYIRWHRQPAPASLARVVDIQSNAVDTSNAACLVDTLKRIRPDVVYLWNTTFIGGAGIAGTLAYLQIPVVWHLMDDAPRSAVTVGGQSVISAARLLSHRLRARYLLCSQRLRHEIAEVGFDFRDHDTLLPNWVAPVAICDRKWFPDVGPTLRVVAAGQLAPHKGFDFIMEAARDLKALGHSAYSIDIFGGGIDDHYRSLIFEYGLDEHVHLRGMLSQGALLEQLPKYDVFLFPTWRREPFGFAPLEAAARGCIPIISRDCGLAEWLVDDADCIKVAPNAQALTTALDHVLDGTVLLPPLGRRAQWVANEFFSLGRATERVEQALLEACEIPAVNPGRTDDAKQLARLAEHLMLDWAEGNGAVA